MGTTLQNGVYLPNEGERNCYAGLKTNWEILDQKVADVTALQQAVAGALHREIVESLPTTDINPNTIYMILSGTSATENVYNEYMYVNNAWELIGTSATDLANYYTKAEVDGKLLLKANDSDVVHKSGNETVAGVKTFSDDITLQGTTTPVIKTISNIVQDTSAYNGSVSWVIRDKDNLNNILESSLYKYSAKSIDWQLKLTGIDNGVSNTKGIRFTLDPVNNVANFIPIGNNSTSLGNSSTKWQSVYATNYYYGSNNVEFSDKFVTTDTNQTITGIKTFLDVPITFKSSTAELGVTGGNTKVIFTDKNLLNLAGITFGNYGSSKLSYCRFHIYDKDSNNQEVENFLEFSYVNNNQVAYFRPNKSNFASLGTVSNRWSKVYANEYYYGSNNVEFSTKFVTADTAQTISGNKTFSSNVNVYNSDATATTPNLYLRSSKIEVSSQGNTSGDQNLTYLDKNNTTYAYVKGAIQSNGSAVKIRAIAKDSSNNSVVNELQMFAYTNGNKAVFPSSSKEVDLGISNYKWKSFNGVEPSSLSLPSDRSARIDISSYFTNTGTGGTNTYTVPANGYIFMDVTDCVSLYMYSQTTGNLSNYGNSVCRNTVGKVTGFLPVRKDDVFVSQWYTSATNVTLTNAFFIPCQGNV